MGIGIAYDVDSLRASCSDTKIIQEDEDNTRNSLAYDLAKYLANTLKK